MKNQIYLLFVFILSGTILSAQHFEILPINKEYEISQKYCLALDSKNNIYVGTDKGLLAFKENKWNLIQFDGLNMIKKIFVDSKDRVWCIAFVKSTGYIEHAYGNLYRIDNKSNIYTNPLIETPFINSIAEDENGDIWVATGKMGYKVKGSKNPSGIYRLHDSIWHTEIKGGFTEKIVQTSSKLFFLDAKGAGDKGYWYENNKLKELDTRSFWGKQRVLDIAESSNGKTWVCTAENRVQIYNMDEEGELEEVFKINPYRYGPGGGFVVKNDNLYLTYLAMFFAYDKDKNTWICPPKQSNQKLKKYITDIEETSDGSVLIATGDGIKTYKNGAISKSILLEGTKVSIVHELNNDLILIGTKGEGLFLLEGEELKAVKTDSNDVPMPDAFANLVTVDNKVIIVNSTSGILKITID